MKDPQALFMHDLEDMYDAEQRILKMLPKLVGEVTNGEFRSALKHHEEETRTQVQNLEKAFKLLREQPKKAACMGVKGLEEEHTNFLEEKPSSEVLELFDLGAAAKTEHYEICAYTDLMEMASLLGHKDVVPLLRENLRQEQEMARKVESLSKSIAKETVKELQAVS